MDYYNTGSDTPYSYLLLAPHELGRSTWLVFCSFQLILWCTGSFDAQIITEMRSENSESPFDTLLSDVSLAAHTKKVLAESLFKV